LPSQPLIRTSAPLAIRTEIGVVNLLVRDPA